MAKRCYKGSHSSRVSWPWPTPTFDWLLAWDGSSQCWPPEESEEVNGQPRLHNPQASTSCMLCDFWGLSAPANRDCSATIMFPSPSATQVLCRLFSRFFFCNSRACVRINLGASKSCASETSLRKMLPVPEQSAAVWGHDRSICWSLISEM